MGNANTNLSSEQKAKLVAEREDNYKKAAEAILDADILLFSTGAGFSKDSGLAVYKDIADVKAWKDAGLQYRDLSQPHWLEDDPEVFFGFWGKCFNDYRAVDPHKGYETIKKWRDLYFNEQSDSDPFRNYWTESIEMKEGDIAPGPFYVYTSNVDNHFVKAGFHPHELEEIHGNTEVWQCSKKCSNDTWIAPKEYQFSVDLDTMRAPKPTESQIPSLDSPRSEKEETSKGFSGDPFSSNHPRCKKCGALARPNILMFGDTKWVGYPLRTALSSAWFDMIKDFTKKKDAKLVILEIGAGINVPSIRRKSEELIHRNHPNVKLIRINPDFPLCGDTRLEDYTIPIMDSGRNALENIDKNIDEIMLNKGEEVMRKRKDRMEEMKKPWLVQPEYKNR